MPNKNQSILMGGLAVALLNTSYLSFINYICCLGVLIGAVVAVWHYVDSNEATLTSGQGAVLGMLAATVGFFVSYVLNLVLILAGIRHDLAMGMFMYNQFGSQMPPEQADEMLRQLEQPFSIVQYMWGLIALPVFVGVGALGGLIGAKMFKRGGDEPTVATANEV